MIVNHGPTMGRHGRKRQGKSKPATIKSQARSQLDWEKWRVRIAARRLRLSTRRHVCPEFTQGHDTETAPRLATSDAPQDVAADIQFDRMTEEDLLRGLEDLVPPPEPHEEDAG
jgi:hypothetical protein